MLFKKILLALVLLIVLVGIAYLKTERQNDQSQNAFNQGLYEGSKSLNQSLGEIDSLRYSLGQQEVTFAESLLSKDRVHFREIDSLTERIDLIESGLSDPQKELKGSNQATSKTISTSTDSKTQKQSRHEQILSAYKKRFKELPSDLSVYEKRVAINEIKEETARDFQISIDELNKIRTSNKLDY